MEDEKLIALLNEKFSEVNTRFDNVDARFSAADARFDAMDARFDRVETEVRHAHVKIEELRGAMQLNNELIHGVDEKLERFRNETTDNFQSVRSAIGTSNEALRSRVTDLENTHS